MIRPARPDDLPAIAQVLARARAHATGGPLEAAGVTLPGQAWVWDQDGVVAGAALLDGDTLTLAVDPVAQGAGVGVALHDIAVAAGARRAAGRGEQARVFLTARGWRETLPDRFERDA